MLNKHTPTICIDNELHVLIDDDFSTSSPALRSFEPKNWFKSYVSPWYVYRCVIPRLAQNLLDWISLLQVIVDARKGFWIFQEINPRFGKNLNTSGIFLNLWCLYSKIGLCARSGNIISKSGFKGLTNCNESFDIRTIKIGLGVEVGDRTIGRFFWMFKSCQFFRPNLIRRAGVN